MELLKVHNHQIVTAKNKPIRLRGWNIGGWLNMEDFINGFVGAEHNLRATMSRVVGKEKAQFFFDRLLDHFFTEEDVKMMAKFGGLHISKHWGGGPNNSIASRPVATLTDRYTILIASSFIGSLDHGVRVLDGNAAVPTGFLLELDLDGNPLWAASFGQDVLPNGVVSVGEGKVVVGGVLKGSLGLLAGDPQPSNGGSDVFLFEIALP